MSAMQKKEMQIRNYSKTDTSDNHCKGITIAVYWPAGQPKVDCFTILSVSKKHILVNF